MLTQVAGMITQDFNEFLLLVDHLRTFMQLGVTDRAYSCGWCWFPVRHCFGCYLRMKRRRSRLQKVYLSLDLDLTLGYFTRTLVQSPRSVALKNVACLSIIKHLKEQLLGLRPDRGSSCTGHGESGSAGGSAEAQVVCSAQEGLLRSRREYALAQELLDEDCRLGSIACLPPLHASLAWLLPSHSSRNLISELCFSPADPSMESLCKDLVQCLSGFDQRCLRRFLQARLTRPPQRPLAAAA